MGRLIRAADGRDPLRALHLDDDERSCLASLTQSAGFRFTVGVQRSWCIGRATRAGSLTVSILPAELRTRLLEEWTGVGGGTASFTASEADSLLEFIAARLSDPSQELTVCRLEQATLRADSGKSYFTPPDFKSLDTPQRQLQRGPHAAIVSFEGELHPALAGLSRREPLPALSGGDEFTLLFAPGLERLCRPALPREVALWQAMRTPLPLAELRREGYDRDDVKQLLRVGALEFAD